MCRCGYPGCELTPPRTHFCTVCGRAHYTSLDAEDCCDHDVTENI